MSKQQEKRNQRGLPAKQPRKKQLATKAPVVKTRCFLCNGTGELYGLNVGS
jgi:hypothetical protein